VTFDDFEGNPDAFDALGADFARDTGAERVGAVGKATARLMSQRALVDYGVEWLRRKQ
jgi:aminoglycoside 3-N-acetyltransferase